MLSCWKILFLNTNISALFIIEYFSAAHHLFYREQTTQDSLNGAPKHRQHNHNLHWIKQTNVPVLNPAQVLGLLHHYCGEGDTHPLYSCSYKCPIRSSHI